MFFQACRFKQKSDSNWQPGIAQVSGWNMPDARFIISCTGEKFPNHRDAIYVYRLVDGPNCYLELNLLR